MSSGPYQNQSSLLVMLLSIDVRSTFKKHINESKISLKSKSHIIEENHLIYIQKGDGYKFNKKSIIGTQY